MLTVREFVDDDGRSPFREWLLKLDQAVRARIQARILRFELGNLGDHKQSAAACGKEYWTTYLKEAQHGSKK